MTNEQESEEVRLFKETKIKAEQGDAKAQVNLGVMYHEGEGVPKDYKEAAKWYRKAAEQGDDWMQYILGLMYSKGQGVPQDYVEAAKWFRKAAEQGFAMAQVYLSAMYEEGQGVPKDYVEAYAWFLLAKENGYEDSSEKIYFLEKRLTVKQGKKAQARALELRRLYGKQSER